MGRNHLGPLFWIQRWITSLHVLPIEETNVIRCTSLNDPGNSNYTVNLNIRNIFVRLENLLQTDISKQGDKNKREFHHVCIKIDLNAESETIEELRSKTTWIHFCWKWDILHKIVAKVFFYSQIQKKNLVWEKKKCSFWPLKMKNHDAQNSGYTVLKFGYRFRGDSKQVISFKETKMWTSIPKCKFLAWKLSSEF